MDISIDNLKSIGFTLISKYGWNSTGSECREWGKDYSIRIFDGDKSCTLIYDTIGNKFVLNILEIHFERPLPYDFDCIVIDLPNVKVLKDVEDLVRLLSKN